MSHRRKKRRANRRRSYRHRARNPVVAFQARRSRRRRSTRRSRRRRNPAMSLAGGRVGGMVTNSLWAIGGMLGTRLGTQAVLGAQNKGLIGYAANAASAFVLGGLADRVRRGTGKWVTFGGFLGIVARAVTEYTPFGSQVTQAFQLQGMGDWALAGFVPQTFFAPLESAGWPAVRVPGAVAAPAASVGTSGLGRYSLSRYSLGRY